MKFNWEEFKASDNIAVHCKTEEEAIDFCKHMHEYGMEWRDGQSYLKLTNWKVYEEETVYEGDGTFASLKYYTENGYTTLEWSDYEKENSMNLELNNLTEEQKKQIIELAKKFEQENEVDKLDLNKDFCAVTFSDRVEKVNRYIDIMAQDMFDLGLTAHTKEEAEKIRRRLLVEKELRDWAKKCKKQISKSGKEQICYTLMYSKMTNSVYTDYSAAYLNSNIVFTDKKIAERAIEKIGYKRIIRDYFGIDK